MKNYINIKDEKDILESLKHNLKFKDLPFKKKFEKGLYWTGWYKHLKSEKANIYWMGLVKLKDRWDLVAWGASVENKNLKDMVEEVIVDVGKCLSRGIWEHKGKKYKFTDWLPESKGDPDLKRF